MRESASERFLVLPARSPSAADRILAALGGSVRDGMALSVMLVASFAVSAVLVATDGNMFAGAALLGAIVVLCLTLYRIEWGLYLFVGFVLTFDQFDIPGFDPITLKVAYFHNLKEIPYLPSIGAAVLNPLECQLLLLLLVWFVVTFMRKHSRLTRVPGWGAALVFFFGVVAFLIYGLRQGGEFLPALWEVRALFYFGILYFFVPQIIKKKEDVRAFFWVCTTAIAFKAFQADYRFVRMGFSTRGLATLTNHEDPLFILSLVVFLFGLVLFEARSKQKWALIALLLPFVIAFYVGQRRAAYAAIVPMMLVLVMLLPQKQRWMLVKNGFVIFIVVVLYAVVFWDSESRIASPLKLIKTGLGNDRETAGERYYSNLYREYEKYNLAVTAQTSPIIGIGFGNKYEEPMKLANIPFPLRDYIPHNEVLWLIVKTGAVGFTLFWFFLNSFACNGGRVVMNLRDPYLRAVVVVAVAAVIGQIVVSYYDLQLTYYRNMVYLGAMMGLVPAVESIEKREAHDKQR
ncbi:MAG TPA: O-antigen ligase family protein [Bacteroidota bacterium]